MPRARRIATFLKIFAIFVLAGPPIGALVFFAMVGLLTLLQSGDLGGLVWISLLGLIYGVPLSYLIGIGPAAVAGAVIAARTAFYRGSGLAFATMTGTGIGLGLNQMGGRSILSRTEDGNSDYTSFALLVLTCLVATLLCWGLSRALVSPRGD